MSDEISAVPDTLTRMDTAEKRLSDLEPLLAQNAELRAKVLGFEQQIEQLTEAIGQMIERRSFLEAELLRLRVTLETVTAHIGITVFVQDVPA